STGGACSESPTLARRFPSGPGDTPLPAGTSTARTVFTQLGPPPFRGSPTIRVRSRRPCVTQHGRKLKAAVERARDADERRVGLPRPRVDAERLLVREHVV